MPWPVHEAISHGLSILGWFENFQESEMPDENLWDDAEAIERHFKVIIAKRDEGYSGDTTPPDEEMMGNDLVDVFKR